MSRTLFLPGRRGFLCTTLSLGAAAFFTPGAFAEQLMRTPPQTEGPFYPDRLPLDTDNDLIVVNDALTPAVGQITHLSGKVLDAGGSPIRNAVVEIWQCDSNGVYLHTADDHAEREKNFQGFGRFLTSSTGEYYFRTIKPVPYPGRTPHIHFKVKKGGKELLTTQCYIKGEARNLRDGIFRSTPAQERDALLVAFTPLKDSRIGELTAQFNVVIGRGS
jgi:protocatechuate 3,4-dioxygenase beta subunit